MADPDNRHLRASELAYIIYVIDGWLSASESTNSRDPEFLVQLAAREEALLEVRELLRVALAGAK